MNRNNFERNHFFEARSDSLTKFETNTRAAATTSETAKESN